MWLFFLFFGGEGGGLGLDYTLISKNINQYIDNNLHQKQVYKYVWYSEKKHTQKIYLNGQPVTMVTDNNEGKKWVQYQQ